MSHDEIIDKVEEGFEQFKEIDAYEQKSLIGQLFSRSPDSKAFIKKYTKFGMSLLQKYPHDMILELQSLTPRDYPLLAVTKTDQNVLVFCLVHTSLVAVAPTYYPDVIEKAHESGQQNLAPDALALSFMQLRQIEGAPALDTNLIKH